MTTIDSKQQRYGRLPLGHITSYSSHPQFTNPWVSSASSTTTQAPPSGSPSPFVGNPGSNVLPHLNLNNLAKPSQPSGRSAVAGDGAMAYRSTPVPVTAASAGSPLVSGAYRQRQELVSLPQDLLQFSRMQPTTSSGYDATVYTTAASPVSSTYTPSTAPYDPLGYASGSLRPTFAIPEGDSSRRYSQQSVATSPDLGDHLEGMVPSPRELLVDNHRRGVPPDDRKSFQDALEASHGMLSMSQETPRNIYDVRAQARQRSSAEYGFPSAHSSTSSVSSTGFSGYYAGSADGSVSDYSTAGSDIESLSGRSLPRPPGLLPNQPPAPQTMMGSFSSKASSTAQKKHKCKVCDKRFTRPSSLQTHMYSHTGEKPFPCKVPGCGRQFSVVSNLRRHYKVHNLNSGPSETGSEVENPQSD